MICSSSFCERFCIFAICFSPLCDRFCIFVLYSIFFYSVANNNINSVYGNKRLLGYKAIKLFLLNQFRHRVLLILQAFLPLNLIHTAHLISCFFSHMIRFFSSLFSEDDNTTNQHYQKQTRSLSLIVLILLDIFAKIPEVLQ